MWRSAWWWCTAGVGAVLTTTVLDVRAVPSAQVVVALETSIVLTGGLATHLMLVRYRGDRRPGDFLLVLALGALTAGALPSWWIHVVDVVEQPGPGGLRFAALDLLGALAFAVAAWVPEKLRHPADGSTRRSGSRISVSAAAAAVLVGLITVPGTALARTAEGLGVVLLVVAAVGFARRSSRAGDAFRGFLAVAALTIGLSRLDLVLDPTMAGTHPGEMIRAVGFLVLLVGALYEVRRLWERDVVDSRLAERRRMARELHDGFAHEAAYIATAAREIAGGQPTPGIVQVIDAAERALDETRRVIHVLTRPPGEPLDQLLVAFAEQVAHRAGAHVRADCQQGLVADAETAQALTRVVREAVTNAVRHGHAGVIELALHGEGRLRLTIRDDGVGFDPSSTAAGAGFGLISMRERVAALGGDIVIDSSPGTGTSVEVVL